MGFAGATKRKRAHLKFYAIVQTILVTISVVALLTAVIGLFGYSVAHHEQFVTQYNSLLSQTHISSAAFITLVAASTLYQICLWWLQIRSVILANKMVRQLDELPYLGMFRVITLPATIQCTDRVLFRTRSARNEC